MFFIPYPVLTNAHSSIGPEEGKATLGVVTNGTNKQVCKHLDNHRNDSAVPIKVCQFFSPCFSLMAGMGSRKHTGVIDFPAWEKVHSQIGFGHTTLVGG